MRNWHRVMSGVFLALLYLALAAAVLMMTAMPKADPALGVALLASLGEQRRLLYLVMTVAVAGIAATHALLARPPG